MEPELRGIVEQYVDFALSDAQMLGYGRYVNTLKTLCEINRRHNIWACSGYDSCIMYRPDNLLHRGKPTPNQLEKLLEIVKEKIPKIRSRVLETLV